MSERENLNNLTKFSKQQRQQRYSFYELPFVCLLVRVGDGVGADVPVSVLSV